MVVPAGVHVTDFGSAARVYWTLKVAGVPDVSILDGGFAAWAAAGLPTESGNHAPVQKTLFVDARQNAVGDASRRRNNREIRRRDADRRAPASALRRQGEGAEGRGLWPHSRRLNLDSAEFYDAQTNRLRPKAELAAIAARLPAGPLVSYCNTGHWSATDWFVLHELLGRKDVKVYDGSMVEWTADPNRPVASARTKWDDLKKALGLGS